MRTISAVLFAFCLLQGMVQAASKSSQSKPKPPGKASTVGTGIAPPTFKMDTTAIHSAYQEGDFESVLKSIEGFWSSQTQKSRSDSLFAFRYLGVVYAANAKTLELGKTYLRQLVETDPKSSITDMYVSDAIYLMFRNELELYRKKHPESPSKSAFSEEQGAPIATQNTVNEDKDSSKVGNKSVIWIAGGVALAASTVGIFYWSVHGQDSKPNTIKISE